MSATQMAASQQFIHAMGPMIDNPVKMAQILNYIEYLKVSDVSELSDEAVAKLIPFDTVVSHLHQKVHEYYQA
ncbi:MAG: hypothetical protein MJZ64_03860 [Paludibacteraceae bacterium]|nr:hypothetical protein [Paludibacteraceae bacterium]